MPLPSRLPRSQPLLIPSRSNTAVLSSGFSIAVHTIPASIHAVAPDSHNVASKHLFFSSTQQHHWPQLSTMGTMSIMKGQAVCYRSPRQLCSQPAVLPSSVHHMAHWLRRSPSVVCELCH